MKGLVLLGEGQGEGLGLPILIRRLLAEKDSGKQLYADKNVLRVGNALGLVKWDEKKVKPDPQKWVRYLKVAASRPNTAGVLAVFDGDTDYFPAGSRDPFCVAKVAKLMVQLAKEAGAGITFSLAVVFACVEYETWLVAGADSLVGKRLVDGRIALPTTVQCPNRGHASLGKGWLLKNMPDYRPTRDQGPLTQLVDLQVIRSKRLSSFFRLEHAIDQLVAAARTGVHISTPS